MAQEFAFFQQYIATLLSSDKKVAHILIQLGTYFKEHESDMFYLSTILMKTLPN